MNKKAQGLPLNVVIVAALVLIVLVVLVVIFSGRTQVFTEGTKGVEKEYSTQKCEIPGTGRKCYTSCPEGKTSVGVLDCEGGVCCQ